MRKMMLRLVLFVACNSATVRVARPEEALKESRAQGVQAGQVDVSVPSVKHVPVREISTAATATVQPVAPAQVETTMTATVDHSASWNGVEGEFDKVSPNITDENFPPEQGGTASVALIPLKLHRDGEDGISAQEAERRFPAQEFRPATGRELRAFAKANPEFQRQFRVVALGSSWLDPYGNRKVLYLDDWDGKRALSLHWLGGDWDLRWRFLAVRK